MMPRQGKLLRYLTFLSVKEVLERGGDVNEALKDQLCRYLVQDYLLTPVTKPESEPLSRRVL